MKIESLEPRRLLTAALPTDIFAQSDDTYALVITGNGTANAPSLASTPVTSVAWGLSNSTAARGPLNPGPGEPDDFVVTLPSGPASVTFLRYFVTGSNASMVRISQRDSAARLRARWEITGVAMASGSILGTVSSFTQSLGPGGVTYDTVGFTVPRMANTYNVPNPGAAPDPIVTTTDFDFVTQGPVSNPSLSATKYMSTSTEFLSTIELGLGQLPVTSYTFFPRIEGIALDFSAVDFSAVAGVDGVPLWSKCAHAFGFSFTQQRIVTTQRDSLARPVHRVQLGGTGQSSAVGEYSFYDTTLDSEPRIETYRIVSDASQVIGYSYNAGTGAMNTPLDSFGWNWTTNTPFSPNTRTAFIKPPTSGPRNTPLSSIAIQFSESTPTLALADFRFENLNSAGLTLTTSDNLTWTLAGNLSAQQSSDGDYAVKFFAIPAGVNFTGSTGIRWTLDTTPPALLSRSFEYQTGHDLFFNFSENVGPSLSPADITLQNLTNSTTIPAGSIALQYTPDSAHVTFPGLFHGILPDGNYRATLAGAGVTDPAGNSMASSDVSNFFVFAGDANRDRSVNLDDFTILAASFGQTGRVFAQGNFNYSSDGAVNLDDFTILASQFGKTLPAAGDLPRSADVRVMASLFAAEQLASRHGGDSPAGTLRSFDAVFDADLANTHQRALL